MAFDDALTVDVLIAGGGPAGLATAIGLKRACPSLQVLVVERAKRLHPSGGNIGITTPNAFTALNALGPDVEAAVRAAAVERRSFKFADMHGIVQRESAVPGLSISWFDLQQALLQVYDAPVELASGVQEVEEKDGWVYTRLAGDTTVRSKLLVGADGNRSECRQYIEPGHKVFYTGATVWRFFMPTKCPFVEYGDKMVMTGEGKVFGMAPVKRDGQVLTYCSGLSGFPEERLPELNQQRYIQDSEEDQVALKARLDRFLDAFQSFSKPHLDFVREHAVAHSFLEHPMYALDPRFPWSKGNVVLVGDAAHVMPPNYGQGTPAAFEDAVQLAASIRAHGLTEEALEEYEQVRKERLLEIWDRSTNNAIEYYAKHNEAANPYTMSEDAKPFIERVKNYKPPALT